MLPIDTDNQRRDGWRVHAPSTDPVLRKKWKKNRVCFWVTGIFMDASVSILALFLVFFVAVVFISLSIFWNMGCSLEDFQCHDSTCLSEDKFCDGVEDCVTGEDEMESYCRIQTQIVHGNRTLPKLFWDNICRVDGVPGQIIKKNKKKITELRDQNRLNSFINKSLHQTPQPTPSISKMKARTRSEEKKAFCFCQQTTVKCVNFHKIPDTISGNVTKLILPANGITDISAKVMELYPSLEQGLYLQKNKLKKLKDNTFKSQRKLLKLYLYNNNLGEISEKAFHGLKALQILQLHKNKLRKLPLQTFISTPSLRQLLLSYNSLTLSDEMFPVMVNLSILYLQRNQIKVISKKLFSKLENLRTLSLRNNRISSIDPEAFDSLHNLQALDLSHNLITTVANIFEELTSLQSLNLRGLHLDSSEPSDYKNLFALRIVYFPRIRYCHFVEHVEKCEPRFDGITTKEDLVHSIVLRVSVWVVAFLCVLANIMVILCRAISKGDDAVLVLFIKNLAMADLLMGVYLTIVGVQDQRTRGNFFQHAVAWTSSPWCSFAGFLALVSSEASVFILAFMSLQRYLHLTRSLYGETLSKKFASRSLAVIWVTSIILAVFPVIWMSNFYGINSMCFPMHISEPYLEGWEFSAFVFLGLNTFCMLVIVSSYLGIFINIKMTRSETPLSNTDVSVVLRFLFIVLTDCACWLPILAFKIVALSNVPIPGQAYAWLVVLVLPVNSALNPVLYTFSTTHFMSKLKNFCLSTYPNFVKKSTDSPNSSLAKSRNSLATCSSKSTRTSSNVSSHPLDFNTISNQHY